MSKMTSYVYIFYPLDATNPSNDDNNQVYAGLVIAGGLLLFIIIGIVIIGIIIIVIRKKKYTRLPQQTTRSVMVTPPQASVSQYTYPSACNPSHCNPTYPQPQISTDQETMLSGVPQSAAFHHDTEHAAVGSTSNPSALSDDAVIPPPCEVESALDESTNEQSTSYDDTLPLLPPDYDSVVSTGVSVPVPPVNNI